MSRIEIVPQSVTVRERQGHAFTAFVDDKPVDVDWSLQPSLLVGSINDAGVYKPPFLILRGARVVVVATPKAGAALPGRAVIELSPDHFWTQVLGVYWLLVAILITVLLATQWDVLCPACDPLVVTPPIVTLGSGQVQQFRANHPVRWSEDLDAAGVFRAPSRVETDHRVTLTATTIAAPERSASATVYLSKEGGLGIEPAAAVAAPGRSIQLTAIPDEAPAPSPTPPTPGATPTPAPGATPTPAPTPATIATPLPVIWMRPEAGRLVALDGGRSASFTAPDSGRIGPVTILARTAGRSPRLAGASVLVGADAGLLGRCGPNGDPAFHSALLLVFLMGALGGLIHGIGSFATYVGNRELLPSWTWWYLFKPVLGGLVALSVYLVFRAGFGSADFSLGTGDCIKMAAFAVLIGLFAESATLKLKDIFETIFTPRRDPRQDKAGTVAEASPKITKLEPATLVINTQELTVTVKGSSFAADCQVQVEGKVRKHVRVSATELKVTLEPADVAQAGSLTFVVYNEPPTGPASNEVELKVE